MNFYRYAQKHLYIWLGIIAIILIYPLLTSAQVLPTDTSTDTSTPAVEEPAPAPEMPVGPSVSNISVIDITDTSARIDVNSDEMVQGYVEYGTDERYGMSTPLTSEFTTSPEFLLEKLTPKTLYHYRVIIMDSSGNAAITTDKTFTTLATPEPEPEPTPPADTSTSTTTPPTTDTGTTTTTTQTTATSTQPSAPVISNVSTHVSTSSVTVTWTTSSPATSDIRFGTTTSYGNSVGKNSTFTTSHSRTISSLSGSTTYHFRLIVSGQNGTTGLGKDRTFTTANTATSSAAILSNITQRGSQAAASQGGGGLPTVPRHPYLVRVTPLDGQVAFDWKKDYTGANGEIHTIIVKKQGTYPVQSRIDGDIIYDGPSTTFTDTNLQNGVEYHYALYSYGAFGRFTSPARFKVIPTAGIEQENLSAQEMADEVTSGPTFSRDLSKGIRGDDVATLQAYLAGHGFYPEALVTGYFGALTKSAVMRYQKLNTIVPPAGYVGPLTQDALRQ